MEPTSVTAAMVDQVLAGKLSRREALRRAAGLGLSTAFAGALLARGGSAVAAQGAASYKPKGPKVDKLVFWTRSSKDTSKHEWDALQKVADAYKDAIGTKVELSTVPDADFRNKLSLAGPSGNGPDIFGPLAHDWIGQIAFQKIALEWAPDKLTNAADFEKVFIDACSINSKIFAYPLFTEALALIYNKDMVPEAPKTWGDLLSKAKELTKDDNYGFAFPVTTQYYQGPFYFADGSYIFKYANGAFDTKDIGLNNPAGIEASKSLRDMYNKKQPEMPDAVADPANGSQIDGMMEAGQIAMTIGGPWREPPLKDAGINYGVALLPTWTNGKPLTPFLGVQAMLVNAYGKQQDAAIDFVSYMCGAEGAQVLVDGFNKTPARTSLLQPSLKANPNFQVWADQAKTAIPMPNIPAMDQVWGPWGDAMLSIVQKNASDADVTKLMNAAVDQIKKNIQQSQS